MLRNAQTIYGGRTTAAFWSTQADGSKEDTAMTEDIFDFKCGQCGKMFATLEDLQDHELTAHPDRQVRREDEEEELEESPAG